jgi:hypothetical protein
MKNKPPYECKENFLKMIARYENTTDLEFMSARLQHAIPMGGTFQLCKTGTMNKACAYRVDHPYEFDRSKQLLCPDAPDF